MSEYVKGLEDALSALERIQRGIGSGGSLDQGVTAGAKLGANYASQIVHRRSGALSRAQTVLQVGNTASIGIDPSVTNPRGQRPFVYGPIVAKRVQDFYAMVVDNRGSEIAERVFQTFAQGIEQ